MLRYLTRLLALIVVASSFAASQTQLAAGKQPVPASGDQSVTQPKLQLPDLDKRPKMSPATRLEIIQSFNSELARTLKYIPVGFKDISITPDGKVTPDDGRLYQLAMTNGVAAKVGDQIQITNIVVHEKSITIEVDGGPKGKSHWYQHVTINGAGGAVAPGGNPNQAQPTGAAMKVEFKDHVPEMTGPELKELLSTIFDFSMKTATEVYIETVPPKVRDAIKNHEVLVGMNHDMVVMAKDRPPQKIRERDSKGVEYEEWVYGQPPQDVTFVRFTGDEVTQVKVMKVSGEEVLKTEREVDVRDGVVSLAEATAKSVSAANGETQKPQQSGPAPTLKRPDDTTDTATGPPRPSPPPVGGRPADPTDPTGNTPTTQLPPTQPEPPSLPPPN
jgi:hypothetical protein